MKLNCIYLSIITLLLSLNMEAGPLDCTIEALRGESVPTPPTGTTPTPSSPIVKAANSQDETLFDKIRQIDLDWMEEQMKRRSGSKTTGGVEYELGTELTSEVNLSTAHIAKDPEGNLAVVKWYGKKKRSAGVTLSDQEIANAYKREVLLTKAYEKFDIPVTPIKHFDDDSMTIVKAYLPGEEANPYLLSVDNQRLSDGVMRQLDQHIDSLKQRMQELHSDGRLTTFMRENGISDEEMAFFTAADIQSHNFRFEFREDRTIWVGVLDP